VLRNRLYYRIKPILPQALRLGLRRWYALRKRRQVQGIWPILPHSERPPNGWRGWGGGKRFALVLTHDVEGLSGVEKCLRLRDMEAELGFRSSFNFIPAGIYRGTHAIRKELQESGFEVGVHDLHHDGKLFDSKRQFRRHAQQINQFLREWDAVGFRAGFMLHNLEWITELDVEYDSSTFDTDPFEPQPDGVGTIFPFWVPAPSRGTARRSTESTGTGYVELPYTLPQDSTVFLLLREQSPEIWCRKVDWVAEHGGMVLLNTHPDYMSFRCGINEPRTFPSSLYRDFLEWISRTHGGRFWHALPREVARYYAGGLEKAKNLAHCQE
jgi:peptidoglycan/xylan/chitin deacetylase (PgdA/CDA1 family)